MPQTNLQQIQTLYRQLSPAERKVARLFMERFSGAGQPTASAKTARSDSQDWLLTGILSELARRGLKYSGRTLNPSQFAPNYEEDSAFVRTELERILRHSIPKPKYQELLALGQSAARALADYRNPVQPLGLKFMLRSAGRTLEAIDASFPGYLQAGVLDHLVGIPPKQT